MSIYAANILLQLAWLLPVTAPAAPVSEFSTPCGPECGGGCFDGRCLFRGEGLEPLDGIVLALPRTMPLSRAQPPAARAEPPVLGGRPLDQPFSLIEDAYAPRQTATQGVTTVQRQQFAALASAGVGSSAVPPILKTIGGPPVPMQRASFLARATQYEQAAQVAQLAQAKALVSKLSQENDNLRRELQGWHLAGVHAAEREERLASLLSRAAGEDLTAQPVTASPQAPAGASLSTLLEALPAFPIGQTRNFLAVGGFAATLAAVLCLMVLSHRSQMVDLKAAPALGSGELRGSEKLKNVLAKRYSAPVVSIAEMQVGNLAGANLRGNVYMTVCSADFSATTAAVWSLDNSYLQFPDAFHLEVRMGQPMVFTVYEQNGDTHEAVGNFEIPAGHVLAFARQRKEYFRFALDMEQRFRSYDETGRRPYVAMRLSDDAERQRGMGAMQQMLDRTTW